MSVYETVTNQIIEQLEKGVVPWQKSWKTPIPKNIVSKKPYRGINLLVLGLSPFSSAYWATFRQIKKMGGSVRKGEKSTRVYYVNWVKVEDRRTGDEKEVPFLKQYCVFNIAQTEGLEIEEENHGAPVSPMEKCEQILSVMPNMPVIDLMGGGRAYYHPATDSIHLPSLSAFQSAEAYYGTLFHELVHSTGHAKRLAREGIVASNGFGSEVYSKEELIAELGASFLCSEGDIIGKTIDASASYIAGWLKALKNDKKLIVVAAAQAQRAVDYICKTEAQEA